MPTAPKDVISQILGQNLGMSPQEAWDTKTNPRQKRRAAAGVSGRGALAFLNSNDPNSVMPPPGGKMPRGRGKK